MISDIWKNISNFLDILDIINLIKIKIISKKYMSNMFIRKRNNYR